MTFDQFKNEWVPNEFLQYVIHVNFRIFPNPLGYLKFHDRIGETAGVAMVDNLTQNSLVATSITLSTVRKVDDLDHFYNHFKRSTK